MHKNFIVNQSQNREGHRGQQFANKKRFSYSLTTWFLPNSVTMCYMFEQHIHCKVCGSFLYAFPKIEEKSCIAGSYWVFHCKGGTNGGNLMAKRFYVDHCSSLQMACVPEEDREERDYSLFVVNTYYNGSRERSEG